MCQSCCNSGMRKSSIEGKIGCSLFRSLQAFLSKRRLVMLYFCMDTQTQVLYLKSTFSQIISLQQPFLVQIMMDLIKTPSRAFCSFLSPSLPGVLSLPCNTLAEHQPQAALSIPHFSLLKAATGSTGWSQESLPRFSIELSALTWDLSCCCVRCCALFALPQQLCGFCL